MHKTKKISALPALIAVLALIVCALVVGVFADGGEAEEAVSRFYGTAWSLLPPVIAIVLALITKEVYSSLFVGILAGGLLYSNFAFEGTVLHIFNDGIVAVLAQPDGYNIGILIFLVIPVLCFIFRLFFFLGSSFLLRFCFLFLCILCRLKLSSVVCLQNFD